jgi:hypothetical protein
MIFFPSSLYQKKTQPNHSHSFPPLNHGIKKQRNSDDNKLLRLQQSLSSVDSHNGLSREKVSVPDVNGPGGANYRKGVKSIYARYNGSEAMNTASWIIGGITVIVTIISVVFIFTCGVSITKEKEV